MATIGFYGAVRGVTGSCYLVETSAGKILVDCGMFQGGDEKWNRDPFSVKDGSASGGGFDPKEIAAVFVTHPHADHTGRLPKLIAEGFSGIVYMPEACRPLARIVLEDAAHILYEEAKRADEDPLFTADDVARTFERVEGVGYHRAIEPIPGVSAMFHEAGHVLGSAFVSLEADGRRIVFSGDIGNDDVPILPDTEPISKADIVVCESTYGDRVHKDRVHRRAELMECIASTVKDDGVLLIPSFSIERTQEVLYEMNQILLNDLHTSVPIYLDSPMAIRATQVYRDFKQYLRFDAPILSDPDRDFFSFPNLRETLTTEESKAIQNAPAPKVIIAGSGMMEGGRIMHHLRHYLPSEKTTLLIVGYQAEGTLGRRIQDGAKRVRIYGEEIEVRARVEEIGSFSAHGDRDKLTRWLQPTDGTIPKKIFLVHGDADQKKAFKKHLEQELGTEVHIPTFGEVIEIF